MQTNDFREFRLKYEAMFGEFPAKDPLSQNIWVKKLISLKPEQFDRVMDVVSEQIGDSRAKPRLKEFMRAMKTLPHRQLTGTCAPCSGSGYLRVNHNTVIPCLCPKGEMLVKQTGLKFNQEIRDEIYEKSRLEYKANFSKDDDLDSIPNPEDYHAMMKDLVVIADGKMTPKEFNKKWKINIDKSNIIE